MGDIEMIIEIATNEIIPVWDDLAREVEPLFEGRMAGVKEFREFQERKIAQKEAILAKDSSGTIMGIIAISHHNNGISWFATLIKYRGKGVGNALLSYAINDLDQSKEICVITFKETDPGGLPARRLYHKFGFEEINNNYFAEGHYRCLMKRPANYD
jgi:ribosomal protein S18 acetylase RimI-like enzyme